MTDRRIFLPCRRRHTCTQPFNPLVSADLEYFFQAARFVRHFNGHDVAGVHDKVRSYEHLLWRVPESRMIEERRCRTRGYCQRHGEMLIPASANTWQTQTAVSSRAVFEKHRESVSFIVRSSPSLR